MNGHWKLFKTQAIKPTLGSKQSDWETLENSTNTSTKSNVSVSKKSTKNSNSNKKVQENQKGVEIQRNQSEKFELFFVLSKKKVNPDKTQKSQTTQMAKFQAEIRINWNQIKTLFLVLLLFSEYIVYMYIYIYLVRSTKMKNIVGRTRSQDNRQ